MLLAVAGLYAYVDALKGHPFDTDTVGGAAAVGAMTGAAFGIALRTVLVEFTSVLWHWCRRRPQETAWTLRGFLVTNGMVIAGFAGAFAAISATGALLPASAGLWAWLVLPFLVALLPMYERFILPWVRYAGAPKLAECRTDLSDWVDEICAARRLPKVRLRVHEGDLDNAYAVGGFGAHLIVVGGGLLAKLSPQHLKAIVAHEIAHVARRDVPRLLPLIVLACTVYSVISTHTAWPLFAIEEVWSTVAGALLAGILACAFMLVIPGLCQRRMEFGADRLAAEFLGEGEPLAQALERLAEIAGEPLTKRSWSHPTIQARVDALRSPATT